MMKKVKKIDIGLGHTCICHTCNLCKRTIIVTKFNYL